jgi:hypothetical protein
MKCKEFRSEKKYIYEDRIITEGTVIVPEMKNCSIPLKYTVLKADIKGIISEVEVIQKFYNDLDKKIEAIYVFPLPENNSVNLLEIKIGERIIRGEIKEREEARKVYNEAKHDGRKGALLEEERPNLFTMSVTGIEPGQEIEVKLKYYDIIKYENNEYEFVFPMTITPGYISPEVTDEENISPPIKSPDKNNKRNIHISINLAPGFEAGNIYSPTHKLYIEEKDKSVRKIELARDGELPDKDFVLKYASKGEKMENTMSFYREKGKTGTFMLNLTPKFDYGPGEIVKREIIFVLDRSGSMSLSSGHNVIIPPFYDKILTDLQIEFYSFLDYIDRLEKDSDCLSIQNNLEKIKEKSENLQKIIQSLKKEASLFRSNTALKKLETFENKLKKIGEITSDTQKSISSHLSEKNHSILSDSLFQVNITMIKKELYGITIIHFAPEVTICDTLSTMDQAKDSLKKALKTLRTGDIFNIITFDDRLDVLSDRSLELNEINLMMADNFIESTHARGGTDILSAMNRALSLPSSKTHLRQIVFLTDGAVGNEDFVFREVEKNMGRSRIFTFGIGPSVNRYLLEKMAKAGRGSSYFITDPGEIRDTIERFSIQTSTPVLSDITLEWEGVSVSDTYPSPMPDLYTGQIFKVFGRFHSSGKGKAILKYRTGEGDFREELHVELPEIEMSHPAIETIWAKERIENLLDRQRENPKEKSSLRDEILGLALKYKVITPYTSLVAVEKDGEEKEREEIITVKVPLLPPAPVPSNSSAVYCMVTPATRSISGGTRKSESLLGYDPYSSTGESFWNRVSGNAGFISSIGDFLVPDPGAEVTSRYGFDPMPGKQMAISADLNAGLINPDEAKRIRREKEAEYERELRKARGWFYYARLIFFTPLFILLYIITAIITGAGDILNMLFNIIKGFPKVLFKSSE